MAGGGERVRKRIYYKIGEACKSLDIQPYVLRYWETEFPALNPGKSRSGQRVYGEKELALIRRIKTLLYEEGYTIAGAKKRLDAELAAGDGVPAESGADESAGDGGEPESAERLVALRAGLAAALDDARAILALLERSG